MRRKPFRTPMKKSGPVLVRYLISVLVLILALSFIPAGGHAFEDTGSFEYNRARLVSFILKQYLGSQHYSHKDLDDSLSRATFTLYLKRLDGQKRFLLKQDVDMLDFYATLIDDEIKAGKLEFPAIASKMMVTRALMVQRMIRDILSSDFDFTAEESLETDNDKLAYCSTEPELRERWRKTLKYQVLHQYLTLMEEAKTAGQSGDQGPRQPESPESLLQKAREKVMKNTEALLSSIIEEKNAEQYDRYFNALANAFDPHTDYLPPMGKEDFDITMKGSLEGIGATLREEEGSIKVVEIVTGGPAYRQGQLQPEDVILKVAEKNGEPVDISHMKLRDAIKLIRGKKGTEVSLTVRRPDGNRIVFSIVRDVVQLEDAFVKSAILKDEKNGTAIGYLKIPSFYRDFEKSRTKEASRNVTDDVRAEIMKLEPQNISGLVIDLRNNSGGALNDAVKVTGLFIRTGPVVQVRESEGKVRVLADNDPDVIYSGPVIVLVNTLSASASEIFAAAMQDYGRAVIVGSSHTHGKGTVQSMIDLNRNMSFTNADKYKPLGALKVTTQKFYRVTGESNQYKGVIPDIILPDRFDSLKTGERYLEYALPPDKIQSTSYIIWGTQVQTDLSRLRTNSRERVSASKDFSEILLDSRRISDLQKKTVKSLNIELARKEREEERLERDGKADSPHGRREKKMQDRPLSEEKKAEAWAKELHEDVYIREACAVLADILSSGSTLATSGKLTTINQ